MLINSKDRVWSLVRERVLYGLKSAGALVGVYMAAKLYEIGFKSTHVYPTV